MNEHRNTEYQDGFDRGYQVFQNGDKPRFRYLKDPALNYPPATMTVLFDDRPLKSDRAITFGKGYIDGFFQAEDDQKETS